MKLKMSPKSVRALGSLAPLVLLLSACASAPAPSAPAPAAAGPEPKSVSLVSAFPAPPPDPAKQDQPMNSDELRCSPVRLERDVEGRIVVWNPTTRTLHQADAQGTWTEVPPSFFAAVRQGEGLGAVVQGRGVGSAEEQWYLKGGAGDLFYWKGRPIFFGDFATAPDLP